MLDRPPISIDHLVYVTPDLEATIADLERQLGVRAAFGGRHPGRGTMNALVALSDSSYLEIVGPDPTQDITGPRWFGVDSLTAPKLVTWAAKAANIERLSAVASSKGLSLGSVGAGSRQTSDGAVLRWEFTDPGAMIENGVVPFFIDWGRSPHPAASAPRGPTLVALRAEHPEPQRVMRALSAVGVELPIQKAPQPAMIAALSTARGDVELR